MNIDNMIAKALKEEFEERVEQYSRDTKKHRFSLSYRLWERKTLRDLNRNKVTACRTLKKTRIAFASCVAAVFVLVGATVYAAVNMGRYFFDDKPDYSKLFIENLSSDKTSIEEYYGLPEEDGWKIVDTYANETQLLINYEHEDKNVIFCQRVIIGYIGNVNTENAVVEPISIHEDNDGFFIEHQSGTCSLYWIYEGYLFDIGGNITKSEAINLAYSTKVINL